jgi:uncharacterized protein
LLADPDPIQVIGTEDEWIIKQGLVLGLLGGDALMRPQLVRNIVEYFMVASAIANHRWATRWRISISTNGTLFDEPGVKEFLMDYKRNMSLGISVDGCPEIHNKNRSNSMDAILKNWGWYMDYTGETATTKSTLNRDSIPYLFESLKYMHETLGLHYINQNFIFEPMGETQDDLDLFDKQMERCVEYVGKHDNDLYWSMLHFIDNGGEDLRNKGHCGSGCMPALGINGKIYPCFRFLPHTMSKPELDFNVGDVWSGFNRKERFREVRNQTRAKISKKECLECPIGNTCGWCIGGAFSESGRFYRPTNICGVHKIQDKWTTIYHGSLKSPTTN